MFKSIKTTFVILLILFLIFSIANSSKITAQTNGKTAKITGKFIDDNAGNALRIDIYSFLIDYPKGITAKAKKEFNAKVDKIKFDIKYDSTKAFTITIENAVAGTYSFLGRIGNKDLGLFKTVDGVLPGKAIDLGEVKVKR